MLDRWICPKSLTVNMNIVSKKPFVQYTGKEEYPLQKTNYMIT